MELAESTRRAIDDRISARRSLTEDIAAGRTSLADALAGRMAPQWTGIRVLTVLDALDGIGKVPVRRGLDAMAIAESTLLGELDDAQVDALVGEFG